MISIETPFHMASVSKVVTHIGVFKMIRLGLIDLNTDTNNYLEFEIKNLSLYKDSLYIYVIKMYHIRQLVH